MLSKFETKNTSNQWIFLGSILCDASGRINNYSQAAHLYLTDHVVSTRRVLDETFNDVEVIAYQAYGNQITLQTSSEDDTRDNFTGKELDKEGSYTSIDFDLTINNCTGRDVKIKIVGGEGTTEIKPSISVIGNTVLVKSTMTFYESKYIIALIIQIPDNTPAINYLQDTPEIYPSIKLGSEVKITLTENAADLATTMPPNGGFFIDEENVAYVGLRLNYFGARYLDADIGAWTSPDAAMQFFSLYQYSSNPINSIDPDGNQVSDGAPSYIYNKQASDRNHNLQKSIASRRDVLWQAPLVVGGSIGMGLGFGAGLAYSSMMLNSALNTPATAFRVFNGVKAMSPWGYGTTYTLPSAPLGQFLWSATIAGVENISIPILSLTTTLAATLLQWQPILLPLGMDAFDVIVGPADPDPGFSGYKQGMTALWQAIQRVTRIETPTIGE